MDKMRERFHKLLDGEMSPEEERDLLERLDGDADLRKEFDGLAGAVHMVESSERMPLDASFTSEVIRRLPLERQSGWKRISDFLFGERVLRWNVATLAAVSAVLFLVVATGLLFQQQKKVAMVAGSGQTETGAKTVTLSFYAPAAKTVSLAGDFNKWSVDKGQMKRRSDGTWTLEIPLSPGVYHYMFVLDGSDWVTDPRAESYRDDGFGNKNAILRINRI
jgi:anti-sigma factor RsiW